MSLLSGKPPYEPLEIELIARRFCERRAFGCWLSSVDTKECFSAALRQIGPTNYISMLEDGAIYIFELAKEGKKYLLNDRPKFSTLKWLDAESTRTVLHRAADMEVVAGVLDSPDHDQIDYWVNSFESVRSTELPKLKAQILERVKHGSPTAPIIKLNDKHGKKPW